MVPRAKSMMSTHLCSQGGAFAILSKASQNRSKKLRELAAALVESTVGPARPEALSSAGTEGVGRCRERGRAGRAELGGLTLSEQDVKGPADKGHQHDRQHHSQHLRRARQNAEADDERG